MNFADCEIIIETVMSDDFASDVDGHSTNGDDLDWQKANDEQMTATDVAAVKVKKQH